MEEDIFTYDIFGEEFESTWMSRRFVEGKDYIKMFMKRYLK